MIGARHPKRAVAAHAPPASQDIHLRLVEHVAHVQTAGNVRRRQQNGEGLPVSGCVAFGSGRRGLGKQLLFHPVFGPVVFNCGRVVSFWQVVRHSGRFYPLENGVKPRY